MAARLAVVWMSVSTIPFDCLIVLIHVPVCVTQLQPQSLQAYPRMALGELAAWMILAAPWTA